MVVARSGMLMTAEQRSAAVHAGAGLVNIVHETVSGMRKAQTDRLRRSPLRFIPGAVSVIDLVDRGSTWGEASFTSTVSVTANVLSPVLRLMTPEGAAPMDASVRGAGVLAAIGAAVGDSLAGDPRTRALVPELDLRYQGESITAAEFARLQQEPTETVVVFLHGLGCTENNWSEEVIAAAARASIALVRYPTGSSIADNGEKLAFLLDEVLIELPECRRLILVGHSMGGLVARRAMEVSAGVADCVSDLVTLGSPHGGSPIEKGAQAALMTLNFFAATKPLAMLGHRRSAGIKDLRHGAIRFEDWGGQDPDTVLWDRTTTVPLPDQVTHHAVVASWPQDSSSWKSALVGDGAVRHGSAKDQDVGHATQDPKRKVTVLESSSHLSLISHPKVAELISEVVDRRSKDWK